MTAIREFAPAKVNLTLEVAGRRADGFHEIASLVAFASAGDTVTLDAGRARGLGVVGPFAEGLAGENILARAVSLLEAEAPHLKLGSIDLEKSLPVAAGIGGGSADAAAFLRAVRRANGDASAGVDWHALAGLLGADVPACLEGRSLWMTGVGHDLADIAGGLPALATVLVNPLVEVPVDKTGQVYRALGAGPLRADYVAPSAPQFSDRNALLDFMRARGNHLAPAAETVVPAIGFVLGALRSLPGVAYAAVSGGGPTCFGIFPDSETAEAACRKIASEHPAWWAVAVTLG